MGIDKIPGVEKIKALSSIRGTEAVRKSGGIVQAWDASDGSGARLDALSEKVQELGGDVSRDNVVRSFGDEANYIKEEQDENYDNNGVSLREFKLPNEELADQIFDLIKKGWKQDEIKVE